MLSIPLWIQLIHGFITGFLSAYMGLVLVNIRPKKYKLFLTGLFYDLGVLIIWSIGLPFQIRFVGLTIALVLIINIIWQIGFFRSMIVAILGTLILGLAEAIFFPVVLNIFGISIEKMISNEFFTLLMPAPQIVLSILLLYICLRFDLHLLDFDKFTEDGSLRLTGKRFKLVFALILAMVVLIILQTLCNVTMFTMKGYNMFSLNLIGYFSNIIVFLVCVTIGFLIVQLLDLTHKEIQYEIQMSYVETIEELYTALRSQRHDLANHLQVLYGFLQMGNIPEVKQYLETMIGENINSHNLVNTGNPGLSALLYIKSGIALVNSIDFRISINNQLNNIGISSYELNRIIGNIINNAFDYVIKQEDKAKRVVEFKVSQAESFYLFEISNYGHIDEEIKDKLFEKGFSTKEGEHSGLGLFIVKSILAKHRGIVDIANKNNMVIFSLYIPMKKAGGVDDALSRSEAGGVPGKEFRLPG